VPKERSFPSSLLPFFPFFPSLPSLTLFALVVGPGTGPELARDQEDFLRGFSRHVALFFYYETIKGELKIKPISECRCDPVSLKKKICCHISENEKSRTWPCSSAPGIAS
jgi:hypothetical protein